MKQRTCIVFILAGLLLWMSLSGPASAANSRQTGSVVFLKVGADPDASTRIVEFLTRPEISTALLILAILAMVTEIFVQGFGLPGLISIVAFALYFGGGFLTGNAQWWPVLLFLIGTVLLVIEMAVPGFGIFGVSGIAALLVGVVFAAPTPGQGIVSLCIALAAAAVLIPILYKLLGGPAFSRHFVLHEAETADKGYISKRPDTRLVGKIGEVLAPLRPSGAIRIDGRNMDAQSDGEYLPTGTRIRVVRVEGAKIVVEPVAEQKDCKN